MILHELGLPLSDAFRKVFAVKFYKHQCATGTRRLAVDGPGSLYCYTNYAVFVPECCMNALQPDKCVVIPLKNVTRMQRHECLVQMSVNNQGKRGLCANWRENAEA
jgi:hypothetical protein